MKKFKLFVCALLVVSLMAGCSKKEEPTVSVGGWEVDTSTKYEKGLSDKVVKIFNDSVKDLDGMDYELVGLLGTQVVSGTNYMFLVKGTTVTSEPETSYKVLTVYVDTKNKTEIKNIADFDLNKYANNEIAYNAENVVGGFETYNKAITVNYDETAKTALKNATATYTGAELNDIALLGKQLVSGYNYAFLELVTTTTATPESYIAVVTVYEDLEGNSSINSIAYVDLAEFNN